jgi:hypothetical protein
MEMQLVLERQQVLALEMAAKICAHYAELEQVVPSPAVQTLFDFNLQLTEYFADEKVLKVQITLEETESIDIEQTCAHVIFNLRHDGNAGIPGIGQVVTDIKDIHDTFLWGRLGQRPKVARA